MASFPELASEPTGEPPHIVKLLQQAANRLGMSSRIVDPAYGYLFEVRDGDNVRHLLGGLSALNDAVSCRLAQDKYYSCVVLREAGFRVPTCVRCLRAGYFKHDDFADRSGVEPGLTLARERGYPLITKPNRMSLGRDVMTVHDDAQLVAAVERAWEGDYIALVQTVAPGIDVRLDYLDGALLAGYRRRPIEITGDGKAPIGLLLQQLDTRFSDKSYWRRHEGDEEWGRRVTARGWTQDSVLPEGERIRFGGPVLNLNRWATADVIDTLAPAWHACMIAIGEAMHLRHFGVDFKVPCGEDPDAWAEVDPSESTVIEVNASPSLVQLYRLGHEERAMQGLMRVMNAVMRG